MHAQLQIYSCQYKMFNGIFMGHSVYSLLFCVIVLKRFIVSSVS